MADSTSEKLQKMEEEMHRFEAEIAHQTLVMPAVNGAYSFGSMAFIPSQLLHNPNTSLPTAPPVPPGYLPPPPPPSIGQYNVLPTAATTVKTISAAPQMAGPSELAERAKQGAASGDTDVGGGEVDDDVTRALLDAAAGIVYNRSTPPVTSNKPSTSKNTPGGKTPVTAKVNPAPPPPPPVTVPAVATFAVNSGSQTSASLAAAVAAIPVNLPPPPAPMGYRSMAASAAALAEKQQSVKKTNKKYIRYAGGTTWNDPTLDEWDPNDFRLFCGDLGNEINEENLARAFNRYPSFQKARVVRDKRTNKSRGYGFVSFSDPEDFTRAMREMSGKYVGNRPIKLKKSEWRGRQLDTIRKKEKEKKKLGLKN